MQRRAWFRFGLAAFVVLGGGLSAFMAGCGDDSSGTTTPGDDGGSNADQSNPPVDSGGGTDSGGGDTGTDAGPPHAKAIIVNAIPDNRVGALRVCFGLQKTGTTGFVVPPLLALPDTALAGQPYAGIFPGTGGPLPDLLDLNDYSIRPYAIPAAAIKNDAKGTDGGTPRTCQDLVQADSGVTALQFPDIPAGTFAHGKSILLVATGCLAAGGHSTLDCGSDYDVTNGNVHARIYYLDRNTSAATLGAQFAHESSQLEGILPSGVIPVAVSPAPDAGDSGATVVTPFAGITHFGQLVPDAGATQLSGINPATTGVNIAAPLPDGGVGPLLGQTVPLPLVEALTIGPGGPADYFKNGQNYTFMMVGDPLQSVDAGGGAFNGYGIHPLGFKNDPTLPTP